MTAALRLRTALPSALLLVAVGVLAGCGGGAGSASSSSAKETDAGAVSAGAERSGTPKTVDCPGKATPVTVPAAFTAPLPDGTIVVAVGSRSGGRTVVTGVVPAAEADVLKQLQTAYAGGYTLTEGETEERDAESNFTGNGIVGRWGIRELSDCTPVATRIDAIIQKD